MSPHDDRSTELTKAERRLVLLVAKGQSDDAIAERLTATPAKVAEWLTSAQRKLGANHRDELALIVLERVLTKQELDEWTREAVANRQRLHDAQAIDLTRARIMRHLASREHWLASNEELGRLEGISPDMVGYELGHLIRVLGSRLAVQVTFYLAPVRPLFWGETDQRRSSGEQG